MATLTITLRDASDRLEIQTSASAAMRILNRYSIFLQQGDQSNFKFPLEEPEAGSLVLDFSNVLAIQVADD